MLQFSTATEAPVSIISGILSFTQVVVDKAGDHSVTLVESE